jgi:hypothetical protein
VGNWSADTQSAQKHGRLQSSRASDILERAEHEATSSGTEKTVRLSWLLLAAGLANGAALWIWRCVWFHCHPPPRNSEDHACPGARSEPQFSLLPRCVGPLWRSVGKCIASGRHSVGGQLCGPLDRVSNGLPSCPEQLGSGQTVVRRRRAGPDLVLCCEEHWCLCWHCIRCGMPSTPPPDP